MISLNKTDVSQNVIKPNTSINHIHSSIMARLLAFVFRYWFALFAVSSIFLFMQATLFLGSAANGEYRLNNAVYFIDETGDKDFSSILLQQHHEWQGVENFTFAPTSGKVWLKVDMPEINETNIFLRFKNPLLDDVDVKLVAQSLSQSPLQQTLIAEYQAGDSVKFSNRILQFPNFVLPLSISQQNTTLYISASSNLSMDLGFGLWSQAGFLTFNDHLTILFGIVFGYVLALICYSLTMYATVQKAQYMWFVLYLAAFTLHVMALSGFGFQYLWPHSIGLQAVMGGVSISLTYLCLIKFTQIVLAPTNSLYNFLLSASINVHLALSLLSIMTLNPNFVGLHLVAIILTSLLIPIVCYAISKTGSVVAKFFMFVWLVFFMTSFIAVLATMDIMVLPFEHIYTLFIGLQLQTLMIGAALIYIYRVSYLQTMEMKKIALREKAKTAQSKDQILQLQKDAQLKLKQQVKAQTLKLEGALDKLSSTSSELILIRNHDSLTGLPNRLAFDESLVRLSKLSIEKNIPLCVAIVDIDYFKNINDTYGHLAGDDCLRVFSGLLSNTFHVDDYAYCRFGGEEFLIITTLPLLHVKTHLEEFRRAVQSLEIHYGGHTISFTISVGAFSKQLLNEEGSKDLLSKADENLYIAKHKGRNLVVA